MKLRIHFPLLGVSLKFVEEYSLMKNKLHIRIKYKHCVYSTEVRFTREMCIYSVLFPFLAFVCYMHPVAEVVMNAEGS